jgi:hypothetical protein
MVMMAQARPGSWVQLPLGWAVKTIVARPAATQDGSRPYPRDETHSGRRRRDRQGEEQFGDDDGLDEHNGGEEQSYDLEGVAESRAGQPGQP